MKFQLHSKTVNTLVVMLCVYLVYSNFHFHVGQTISFDVYGYYLYLPLTFIYDDLGLQNPEVVMELMEKYHSSHVFYQGHVIENGNYVLKYTMGQSILYAPFFFIGHFIAQLSDYPVDGFSKPYEMSIFVGGIIYTLIGIYFFFKVLRHFFDDKVALIVLFATVIGTNYLLQNTMFSQNPMTQNSLFTCYTIIIWLTIKWHQKGGLKTIIYLGLLCGVATLIRPTELVCFFIPLLWGVWNKESFKAKVSLLKKNYKQILIFSFLALCIVSLQLIYFKTYTGSFFYSEYSGNNGEGLDMFPPHTVNLLFSFRKGWLIYTPIMIFALIGFRALYKRNRPLFWPFAVYFLINLWFVSSWSNWWYAGSFSQRALIPSYVVLGITLGYFLVSVKEQSIVVKSSVAILITLLVGLNLFQTNQYRLGILHPDRMTKAYYFETFGSLDKDVEAQKLLLFDRDQAYINKEIDSSYRFIQEFNQDFESISNPDFTSKNCRSGEKGEILSMENPYSQSISKKYSEITSKEHVWLHISAWVYSEVENKDQQFYIVTHADHKGKVYQYETLDSKTANIPIGKWTEISFNYLSPPIRRSYNEIKANIWFREGKGIIVDDLKMEVWE